MINFKTLFLSILSLSFFNQIISMEKDEKISQNNSKANFSESIRDINGLTQFAQISQSLILELYNANNFDMTCIKSKSLIEHLFAGLISGFIKPKVIFDFYNKENKSNNSPLHLAVLNKDLIDIFAMLIKDPALLDKKNSNNAYAIELAIAEGNHNLFAFIMSLTNLPNRLLIYACENNNYEYCLQALNIGADINTNKGKAINSALNNNNMEIARLLISYDADIEYLKEVPGFYTLAKELQNDMYGQRLLKKLIHAVIVKADDHDAIIADDHDDYIKESIKLIKKGAKLTHRDKMGNTVLHLAVKLGNKVLIMILIEHDKNLIGTENNLGYNPIAWATGIGRLDIVQFLINLACPKGDSDTPANNNGNANDNCIIS